ncbi:hypothetical protein [Brevibacterium aurantiacum]|uniref:hypothetical protein n=1 Tax=Brevibacterium aurantiacum TaxID=273384 RepID=UPI0018693D23|nr:hypothetical protein [Brevibacterium aurantiacum]
MTTATNDFVLADGCEAITVAEDMAIFLGPDKVLRAVFRVDEDGAALPHCDPYQHGLAVTFENYRSQGVAICDVIDVEDLVLMSA